MTNSKSKSSLTGVEYKIPNETEDKFLNDFILKNKQKKFIAVQGLGFVGTAMSLVVANNDGADYAVIGVDQKTKNSYWKIAEINQGILPINSSDPLVGEYFENTKKNANFYATFDEKAYSVADVIIVDINLDVTKNKDEYNNLKSFDVPLESFKKAIESIGNHCKPDALILIETTVPPGTCKKIVEPIIHECLKKRGLEYDYIKIGHSYERVMPGPNYINSIKNFYRVYSGINHRSADAVEIFLKTIISTNEYPLTRLKNTASTEMAKVLENSYRAMNISFMVEWSRFAEASGVDLYEVVNAIRQRPTHANLMYPGIGVGGYCLTKDPIMASWASNEFYNLENGLDFSEKAVEKNDKMPKYCFDYVFKILSKKDLISSKIGLLGVSYGPGIGDTRFSPVELFYKLLKSTCTNIECHDPLVKYWEELSMEIENSLESFLGMNHDVLILTTAHRNYIENNILYEHLLTSSKTPLVIDTVGLLDYDVLKSEYLLGDNFFILGVGSNGNE